MRQDYNCPIYPQEVANNPHPLARYMHDIYIDFKGNMRQTDEKDFTFKEVKKIIEIIKHIETSFDKDIGINMVSHLLKDNELLKKLLSYDKEVLISKINILYYIMKNPDNLTVMISAI